MKNQGIIKNAIIGVYLSSIPNEKSSFIDFGELDTRILSKNPIIHWVQVISKTSWIVNLKAANLQSKNDIAKKINLREKIAIIDTGSSFISIPMRIFLSIKNIKNS